MKRILIIAAAAGTVFAACTKNESLSGGNQPGDKELAFNSPVTSTVSKAVGEMANPYDNTETFNVYAYFTRDEVNGGITVEQTGNNTPYITDKTFKYNGTSWLSDPVEYWPKNGYLSFHAISPSRASQYFSHDWAIDGTTQGKGFKSTTTFSVEDSPAEQYDLMFSDLTLNQQASSYETTNGDNDGETGDFNNYTGVDLRFRHALSSIRFAMKTAADYSASTTIKVTKVEIVDAYGTAAFAENITLSGQTFAWTDHTTPKTYAGFDCTKTSKYQEATIDGGSELNYATSTVLHTYDLLLLPQALDNVKVKVYFTQQSGVSAAIPIELEANLKGLMGTEGTAGTEAAVDEWKCGKRYLYNITLKLNPITMDPSIEAWVDVTGTDANPTI